MEAFTYRPLDHLRREIRLLEISPLPETGQPEEPLQCKLRRVSLLDTSSLQYETVSYCWGDTLRSSQVRVDGKILSVPRNTERTMRRISEPGQTRTIWIDAVCINQDDVEEKALQIPLMRVIFSSSCGNLINLGEDDGTTSRAVANIHAIVQEIREVTDDLEGFRQLVQADSAWTTARAPMRTPIDSDALTQFFSRPWFSRVWVVQEALLAPKNTCLCGNQHFEFSYVLMVAVLLYHSHALHIPRPLYESPGLQNGSTLWEVVSASDKLMSQPYALQQSSEFDATDARDKVFGMLGIIRLPEGQIPPLLKPDYKRHYSKVIRDATRHAIQVQSHLYILRYVSHRDEGDIASDGFPSWVPRFDRRRGHKKDPALLSLGYRASTGIWDSAYPELGKVHGNPDHLVLQGLVVDEIATLSPIFLENDTSPFWTLMFHLLKTDPSHKPRFARTLTAGVNYHHEKHTDKDLSGFDRWVEHLFGRGPLGLVTDLPAGADEALQEATRFNQAIINASIRRRWALTKTNLMALVPKVSKVGDIVAFFGPADTPYVLRSDGNEHLLLGDCYLEDNMEGEPLRMLNWDVTLSTAFTIR